ncbi:MAG: cobaltochelatase subunit CobN [Bacteroidales bacterium]|jgi:cobaltochelatase CobN|nr:cobaltochelatase subunit CobN [Bacteroidales bacterium]
MKRKILPGIVALLVIGALYYLYAFKISPTKVALVNYQEYMASRIIKSTDNSFIDVDVVKTIDLERLKSYDFTLMFGMGLKLTPEQIKTIEESGTEVYLWAATNPNLKLTTLEGKVLDKVSAFLENGGNKNYSSLLNYIRKEVDKKSLFVDSIAEPQSIGGDILFRLENEDIFNSVQEYEKFATEKGYFKEGNDKVVLLTSVPGPFNSNIHHIQSLIKELEGRNYNVYPLASFRKRIDLIKEINPKLVIYMPHGRITMGRTKKAIADLKKINVPILCPVSAFQRYDKWLKDKQGMFGGILSQSVTMPELDGGIAPYAINALYEDENGYLVFKAIPDRLKKFGNMVDKYIKLSKQENADKKVAIVYFKGPGKNAMVAANMEVLPSLHNTLKRLKREGYKVTGLPEKFEDFKKLVMKKGPVLGPYAEGAFSEFLENGSPELIPADLYNSWTKESVKPELMEAVNSKYGVAPGTYMAVRKDNKDYLAVSRVDFGNVVILPQPMPGVGENTFQLVHGAKTAPPHSYIAPYLWIQHGFRADAVIHFGTHGSLEFTPGKQIALSDYDWTDPLIGTTPHFYVYTISNVGEGMIAKRRSYSATSTYLTPPFIESKTYNELNKIQKKLRRYASVSDDLKEQYARSVKEDVVKMQLHKDVGLDSIVTKPYTEEEILKLTNFVEQISNEKIAGGLYALTVPYTKAKIDETVTMMSIDPIAFSLADYDILKGIADKDVKANQLKLNRYRDKAKGIVLDVLKNNSATGILNRVIDQQDYKRAINWKKGQSKMSSGNIMGMMMSMGGDKKKAKADTTITDEERRKAKVLLAQILPYADQVEHIKKLESDKKYESAVSLLNEKKLAKVRKISKYVTKMQKGVELASNPNIKGIVTIMSKAEGRRYVLQLINDENINEKLEQERIAFEKSIIDDLANVEITEAYNHIEKNNDFNSFNISQIKLWQRSIKYITVNKNIILNYTGQPSDKVKDIFSALRVDNAYTEVDKAIAESGKKLAELEQFETEFSEAILMVESTINSVLKYKLNLQQSPEKEMMALLNGLNGGYIAPTPGGDPVANPATLPTGRNLFAVNTEATPSKEAWERGKQLANSLIDNYRKKHGNYPKKVSFTLWSSSFIETEGSTIAQIFYLLGVEPVWNAFGSVNNLKLIPASELKRPRVDVVVQTSGQLRDLAASRLFLINRAIKMAAEANDEINPVKNGMLDAEKLLIDKGFSPAEARKLSSARVFGGVNGNYGAAIMGMVESGDRWETEDEVAKTYINNMGAAYGSDENWGDFKQGVFEAALLNTEAVVQPRQSNIWGALSLDHVYEFMGGINLAVRNVTGNDPESYFNDFRNPNNAKIQGLQEAIWVETRSTLLNPRYIKEYMKGGASSAEEFAETFRNTYGWNVMKPSAIENRLWDNLYDTYIKDDLNLGVHEFFKRENPYALQEMSAVMLETVRKGYWKATDEQIKAISELHAELVKDHQAGCSGFVCDNAKLKEFISKNLNNQLKDSYAKEIDNVRNVNKEKASDNVVLKKEEVQKTPDRDNTSLEVNFGMLILFLGVIAVILVWLRIRRNRK